ncbi:MAG: hypothetical protein ABJB11_22715 [Ferruginibacter sp.]
MNDKRYSYLSKKKGKMPGLSQYTAHLGNHKEFTKTLNALIDKYGNMGSRCKWSYVDKNRIEDAFPKAVSILDYYHFCYISCVLKVAFLRIKRRENMGYKQKELSLRSEVKE